MKSHYRAATGSVIFDLVCSFARREIFSAARSFFDDANFFFLSLGRRDRFIQESSKSELSSRVSSRLKVENFACHFLANSGVRPRNCTNLITIRPNLGTIG